MNAAQIAEQAAQKIEAEENGVIPAPKDDDDSKKGGDDDAGKKTEDANAGKPAPKDDDSKQSDAADDDKTGEDDDKKVDDEGEFTADDAIEEDAPAAADTKTDPAVTDNAGIQLSPAEQKHIADNIGEPLIVRGFTGEGDNAKQVELKAYSPLDLPRDFKFASDADMLTAQNSFNRLEAKANELLGAYRNSQSNTAAQDFEQRENEGIRQDLAELQKDGKFPKFKMRPGDAGFDDSPEAKQMAEVLKVMADRNDVYLKQYNQGRPYKHIGFAEAFELWDAQNPDRQAAKKTAADQKQEDDARKRTANDSAANSGESANRVRKPTIRRGTTVDQILNRYDNELE